MSYAPDLSDDGDSPHCAACDEAIYLGMDFLVEHGEAVHAECASDEARARRAREVADLRAQLRFHEAMSSRD